jgi:hypothetical protein
MMQDIAPGTGLETDADWSRAVAALAADALADARLIDRTAIERAARIIAEEVLSRLALGHRPPG